MDTKTNIVNFDACDLTERDGILYGKQGNYWSNLSQKDNATYTKDLTDMSAFDLMKKYFPQHEDVIFSPKRTGGIAVMDIGTSDIVLDAGCMWGALSIPVARTGATVVAVDQTKESLLFLQSRKNVENLSNLNIVCGDLKQQKLPDSAFTKAIVNGVLEWIPYNASVEVNNETDKHMPTPKYEKTPYHVQKQFLEKIHRSLQAGGLLYIAIENRYDFLYLAGLPEPHCNIRFISFLPRLLQNIVHDFFKGGEFRTWTYSRKELKHLVESAGFKNTKILYAFPDYRVPEIVLDDSGMKEFYRFTSPLGKNSLIKKIVVRSIEFIVYKILRLTYFAPAFIVIAEKKE